ncbi:MAG: type I-B CRISPR-associated protein Cas5b [Thermodesulfovibrio sp.]|nr:type I-B CRISPR-associated protein Cas5b [Thermodesulfovibrio sp.]
MRVLKLKIYQPQAHYRIPFTYQRRHTYPIPPYSTVKGMLCNLLGIRKGIERIENKISDDDMMKLKKLMQLKVSICGNFQSKSSEYIWFRNLSKNSHIERFGYSENRKVSGGIEHPGGQMPVIIDILNDVEVVIYLFHENSGFIEIIKKSFLEEPSMRIYPLHLGRAEDFIVISEISEIDLKVLEVEANYDKFFWIPERIYKNNECNFEFNKIIGITYNLPTFYFISSGRRNFEYARFKLNDGDLGGIRMFFDEIEKLPVFFFSFR